MGGISERLYPGHLHPEKVAYLADVLARIRDHDPAKLDDLLPWTWSSQQPATAKAA